MRAVEIRSNVFYLFSQPDLNGPPALRRPNTPPILFEVGQGVKLKDCKIGAKPIPHFQSRQTKFPAPSMVLHRGRTRKVFERSCRGELGERGGAPQPILMSVKKRDRLVAVLQLFMSGNCYAATRTHRGRDNR